MYERFKIQGSETVHAYAFAILCFTLMPVSTFAFAEATICEHELAAVEAVEATCQHTGHLAYRQCTKCGAIFDAIESKEVDYQTLVTPIADQEYRRYVY